MLLSTSNPYHTMETQCIFITFVLMSTIMDKIFEANSSFYVNTMGKVQFLFFRSCWLVLKKLSFREGD